MLIHEIQRNPKKRRIHLTSLGTFMYILAHQVIFVPLCTEAEDGLKVVEAELAATSSASETKTKITPAC
jgi:hypothetical protein